MAKTEAQNRFEEFVNQLGGNVSIQIKDIDRIRELCSDFIMRCDSQIEELRKSRDSWKEKYSKLKEDLLLKNTKTIFK